MVETTSSKFRIPLTGRSRLFRYAMAVFVTALATAARQALEPSMGHILSPFPFYYLAVMFAAWYGGYGPGLLATLLSATTGALLFIEPKFSVQAMSDRDAFHVLIFIFVSLVICHLTENLHRSLRRYNETAQELFSSQRRIASVLESVQGCFFNLDPVGRFIHVNEDCKDHLPFTREQLIGKNLWETFPAWRSTLFAKHFENVLAEKKPEEFEFLDSKAAKWYQAYFSPSIDGVSVHLYDINDRKLRQTENAITQILSEETQPAVALRKVLEEVCRNTQWQIGGFWRVDPESGVLRCREIWAEDPARTREFIENSRTMSLAKGEGLPGRVWASGEPVFIKDVTRDLQFPRAFAASREGLVSAIAFPIRLRGGFLGVTEFFNREIIPPDPAFLRMFRSLGSEIGQFIEKKEAEEALKQSRQHFAMALQTAKMGYWSWDLISGRMSWSEDLGFFHGMSSEDFPGTFETFIESIHREDRDVVRQTLLDAVKNKTDFSLEFRTVWPDQSVHWFEARGQVFHDDEGTPLRMIGLGIDINDRKDVERQLIRSNEELELRVIQRTAELAEANRFLEEEIVERKNVEKEILEIAEKEQRRFGAQLHDSLCQELAGILMMARVVSQKLEKKSASETVDLTKVNDLLSEAISRARDLARGLYPVDPESNSLMLTLRELTLRTQALYNISCDFICPHPILVSDNNTATHLFRIAQEAVNNAAKHGEASRIEVRLDDEKDHLVLTVRDDGKGKVDLIRSRPGIGLHIMKYRARMLNASLTIEELSPHGTQLTLKFKPEIIG